MNLSVGGVSVEHAEQFHQLCPVCLGQRDQHRFGTYAVFGRLAGDGPSRWEPEFQEEAPSHLDEEGV